MSVDVTNETQWVIDPKVFSDLGIWVLDQMRVSTQSDLTIMFVDPDPIAPPDGLPGRLDRGEPVGQPLHL